ncbi:MAG: sensor histidine kinase [Gemmatimonas sp.]|nr:HAMP domain-containing sensor histidine kinase [Gemmatimonadaceae bacterium]
MTPALDDALRTMQPVRDLVIGSSTGEAPRWSCSIWPVSESTDDYERLVVEVRDVELIEGAKERQRAVAEQLLLGALREQDAAGQAAYASERSEYLATASRHLSLSLDEPATRDTVRHLSLPRPRTWCIVDVIESNGAIHRLSVVHPDPAKQALATLLEEQWPSRSRESTDLADALHALRVAQPTVLTADSGAELVLAAHGEANLRILREIGFGSLLVVPLVVRARVQGAITFVSPEGDSPFSLDEIGLAVDIAARCAMALDNARLYREADALRLAAETANQSKSQFLGTMSHELRTPLNVIGGFTELIEMGIQGPVTDKQRVALARIKASQQHLLMLITEILNFVRIESGRMEYRFGPTPLAEALADVAGMLEGIAKEKDLTMVLPPGDADVVAWADADRVRQILVNLIMNAVKYTPDGGIITVSCAAVGETAVIRVADTGPGIPADRLESIFEPFVQLTAGFTDRRGGVGLGLPISRDLARAMKGDVMLESTGTGGSCFTLVLPRAPLTSSPHGSVPGRAEARA